MALANILDQMESANAAIQKELQDKLAAGKSLTDEELESYQLTEDDQKVFKAFGKREKQAEGQNGSNNNEDDSADNNDRSSVLRAFTVFQGAQCLTELPHLITK